MGGSKLSQSRTKAHPSSSASRCNISKIIMMISDKILTRSILMTAKTKTITVISRRSSKYWKAKLITILCTLLALRPPQLTTSAYRSNMNL
jgi:hypothetical protein